MIEMKASGRFDEIWEDHRESRTTTTCNESESDTDEDTDENDPSIYIKNAGLVWKKQYTVRDRVSMHDGA